MAEDMAERIAELIECMQGFSAEMEKQGLQVKEFGERVAELGRKMSGRG
jgi:hypothetical protein